MTMAVLIEHLNFADPQAAQIREGRQFDGGTCGALIYRCKPM